MESNEIRSKFLKFFENRGHKIIPSASLVPLNDPTTLFTGSGMQPMITYLLGQPHPLGKRIADSQKSFRAVDIDEVGDNRHTTFFEMLGNWSLGDYFKKEQISWVFEFLIKEIGLDPNKIYVTTFIGDEKNNLPKDTESGAIWKNLFTENGIEAKEIEIGSEENGYEVGMQGGRIFYYDVTKNWWSRAGVPDNMPRGEPGGPDSEMFYEFTDVRHDEKFGKYCHPNCDCGRFLEIGNNVFMEYIKNEDGAFSSLPQKNIDFGGGLERLTMAVNNSSDIIKTNYKSILNCLEKFSEKIYGENTEEIKAFRVIADHIKASVFLIADGVIPSNTDRGYFVRRLLRRAILYWDKLGIKENKLSGLIDSVLESYKNVYSNAYEKKEIIKKEIDEEENKFRKSLDRGAMLALKKFYNRAFGGIDPDNLPKGMVIRDNVLRINGKEVFDLYQTYGLPIEISQEIMKGWGVAFDEQTIAEASNALKEHQRLSQTSSIGMFKGGLADVGEETKKLHTATHLLNAALHIVLGNQVMQKGSNITGERLRFDFSHAQKMTEEEKKRVEEIVNDKIAEKLSVGFVEMPKIEAEKIAAHSFNEKYGDIVKVYSIGDEKTGYFSREFCGGPHVKNTSELGYFKIQKEEAVAQGVRRIKAILVL